MDRCPDILSSKTRLMSHYHSTHPSVSTKHVQKKRKLDVDHQSYRPIVEPPRDFTLQQVADLLTKTTGTLSSTSDRKHASNDRSEQIFDHYSNNQPVISVDGLLRFCHDLSIEPDSYEVLLFCFLCRAKQMYSLTRTEFLLGFKTLDTPLNHLIDIRTALFKYDISSDEKVFYIWTYQYGLIDDQRRYLTTPHAISLWRLFYSKKTAKPEILDQWLNYLENKMIDEMPQVITYDVWIVFPQFVKFIQSNGYQSYDQSAAWPCLFDAFMEHYRLSV